MTRVAIVIGAFLLGGWYGHYMGKHSAMVTAMDRAVSAQCAKDVPVTAIWHPDAEQVIYHFRPTPTQWKDRWCRGREK